MELQKEFRQMIEADIKRIEDTVISGSTEDRWELFREMDGKYQSCIVDFYKGMWQSVSDKNYLAFPALQMHPNQVTDNLKMVRSKLEVFRYQANAVSLPKDAATHVNITNNVSVNISFEQARAKIEDMTSLTDEQTKEVLEKVDAIETIVKGDGNRKTRWEKVKPILTWLADKSFDVGMTIIPLLMQVQG